MLDSMATANPAAPPQAARSFAGLLEEYAAPQDKFPPARDFDGLEDDVATLTYEHALKAAAGYRRDPGPDLERNDIETAPANVRKEPHALPPLFAEPPPAPAPVKSASITVRLSAEENGRLRARAAEASLTVSAYLRSCAFEVETLRAQVKDAIARMHESEPGPPPHRRSWLRRFFFRAPKAA